jgi:hypothetical protein
MPAFEPLTVAWLPPKMPAVTITVIVTAAAIANVMFLQYFFVLIGLGFGLF